MFETDLFGEPVINGHKSVLAQTFEYPPFSVLNARDGWWQERKRQWLALGIESELGRGESPGGSPRPAMDYSSRERGDGAGRPIANSRPIVDQKPPPLTCAAALQLGNGTKRHD